MLDDRSKILFAILCSLDMHHSFIADNRGGVDAIFIAWTWGHQAVGCKEDGCRDIFKFRLLALPCSSEVAGKMLIGG